MSVPVIAIDGPSASGKGTIARRVAQALGYHYLESGALYRLVALVSLREGIAPGEANRLAATASTLDVEFPGEAILLSGQNVAGDLQNEECGKRASEVASLPSVRQALLGRQRAFRCPPGLVADGRDMGTIVFPDAVLKVFLTASAEVRAQRRYKQLIDKGIHANLRALSRDLEERDARDAARMVAPLLPASDAVRLDTSDVPIEAVVGRVLEWYRERVQRSSS